MMKKRTAGVTGMVATNARSRISMTKRSIRDEEYADGRHPMKRDEEDGCRNRDNEAAENSYRGRTRVTEQDLQRSEQKQAEAHFTDDEACLAGIADWASEPCERPPKALGLFAGNVGLKHGCAPVSASNDIEFSGEKEGAQRLTPSPLQ